MNGTVRTLLVAVLAACAFSGCRLSADDLTKAFHLAEKHADTTSRAMEDLTPEQEYYLSRAVGARIVQKYSALNDDKANSYLNKVGQALALHSKQPYTYGGYHFLLLDSGEVNAFATPDGLIFVTRGMVGMVSGESELAAVLAHEIAHVQNKDAIKSIKTSRITDALLLLGKDSASQYGSGLPSAQLLSLFSDSVDDIVSTLVSSGYSRSQEYAADSGAKEILALAGYNPQALDSLLRVMEKKVPSGGSGFGGTHPSAAQRLDAVKGATAPSGQGQEEEARAQRFVAGLGKYSNPAR